MIPRGKLYISYRDLALGIYYCFFDRANPHSVNLDQNSNNLICLSVRTGFDLIMGVLNFPPGGEILVTDINIPDMFSIIAGHKLKAIPIPVDKHTLNISATAIEMAITPDTRAILITHLFGGIMETEEIITVAKKHNLLIFEDCAQAYAGSAYEGNPRSDVVMFSFGFIKTNTAISGAVIKIRDAALYAVVHARNEQYQLQNTGRYLKKLFKVAFVKLITNKSTYTLFYKIVMALGKDFEVVLSGFTKGFPADDLFKQIRYRPCRANQLLLQKKLSNFNQQSVIARVQLANDILPYIPGHNKIGSKNKTHTYWVMPVETGDPDRLISYLRSNGFDASQKASSLVKINNAAAIYNPDYLVPENLVYLPVYPAMKKKKRARLAELLVAFSD